MIFSRRFYGLGHRIQKASVHKNDVFLTYLWIHFVFFWTQKFEHKRISHIEAKAYQTLNG